MSYGEFIHAKSQLGTAHGFAPTFIPGVAKDFQAHAIDWSVRRGRCDIMADCGLGKTLMELSWAQNVREHCNGSVLLLTPLAVASQTVREADKFGIEASRSVDGKRGGGIVVANYDRLHLFEPSDFAGVVCDEASVLKNYSGATRAVVTRFLSKIRFRLLATATPAPNDYTELGTQSEALGELSHSDMLRRFFQQRDDKGQKQDQKKIEQAEAMIAADESMYGKLSFRVAQTVGQWRLKHHAIDDYWRWVASWALAFRMPSDLGFDDREFVLPELVERDHIITPRKPPPGMLFNRPAIGLHEERQERRRTIEDRCGLAAQLVDHGEPAVIWCHTNDEGDTLAETIADAEQVSGAQSDERKVELYEAFQSGQLRVLVIKPKIGAHGLNWQHCAHVVAFASHSYEQHYQAVRRCWRFGQKRPVRVDVVATEGEERVLANMRDKGRRADEMFRRIVAQMNRSTRIERPNRYTNAMELPQWA